MGNEDIILAELMKISSNMGSLQGILLNHVENQKTTNDEIKDMLQVDRKDLDVVKKVVLDETGTALNKDIAGHLKAGRKADNFIKKAKWTLIVVVVTLVATGVPLGKKIAEKWEQVNSITKLAGMP